MYKANLKFLAKKTAQYLSTTHDLCASCVDPIVYRSWGRADCHWSGGFASDVRAAVEKQECDGCTLGGYRMDDEQNTHPGLQDGWHDPPAYKAMKVACRDAEGHLRQHLHREDFPVPDLVEFRDKIVLKSRGEPFGQPPIKH